MELKEKEWDWDKFIDAINEYKRIFVTGPQRSGTRYASFAIADYLDYNILYGGKIKEFKRPYVLPEDPKVNDDTWSHNTGTPNYNFIIDWSKLLTVVEKQERHVTQCPQYSHQIQELKREDTLVVWMERNPDDVIKSEDRIGWHDRCFVSEERRKYYDTFNEHTEVLNQFERNWYMKTWFWNNVQKDLMKVDYVELPYEVLASTRGFVGEEHRKNYNSGFGFKSDQITPKYVAEPIPQHILRRKNNE